MRQYLRVGTIAVAAVGASCSSQSLASTIVAPVTAVATSQFISSSGNNYSIINTINQSGLSLHYISGQTDFNSYLASKPKHTSNANGNEWFSQDFSKPGTAQRLKKHKLRVGKVSKSSTSQKNQKVSEFGIASGNNSARTANKKNKVTISDAGKVTSANISSIPLVSITYGFSALTSINGFALWNEEFAGIGTTELLSSIDGITYTLLSTITPEPSKYAQPGGDVVPYLAQVFSFDLTTMLFFKLLIYDCPKPPANRESYRGCGIGEVAFSSSPPSSTPAVPVPAALPLLGSALGIFAWLGRRQKKSNRTPS